MHWSVLVMSSYKTNLSFTAAATVTAAAVTIGNVSFSVDEAGIIYIKWNQGTGIFRYIADAVASNSLVGSVGATSTSAINPTTWTAPSGQSAMSGNAGAKWMYLVNDVTGESYQVFVGCRSFARREFYIRVHYYQ